MCRRPYLIKFNRTLADGTAECACYLVLIVVGTFHVPSPVFNQIQVVP